MAIKEYIADLLRKRQSGFFSRPVASHEGKYSHFCGWLNDPAHASSQSPLPDILFASGNPSSEEDPSHPLEPATEGWQSAFRTAMELAARKQQDAIRLQELEREVEELTKRIKECGSITVPITSFAPDPFELLKTIQVVVQPSDDEYVASFFDANINASGCTETDAVANLKELMLSVFAYLVAQPDSKLGPGPRRQLAVLKEFIRKRS